MTNLLPFKPNQRTHDRLRRAREMERRRLINRIRMETPPGRYSMGQDGSKKGLLKELQ